ncbi:DNA-directed primase/polymerase protein-like [Hydractinia symbiolongicarpus]|uniref:DNA-directed primase/polymerase protein-like n=1 Tax=Hydractinia symbiolongicarpus TaxID=13093 RepID=UPI00254C2868|nr:DNA-directed primase/polymerase protein-like [Hydractinia symbiolongicarpus]
MNKIEKGFCPKSFYNGSTKKEFIHQLCKKRLRHEREKEFKKRPLPNAHQYFRCFSERNVWRWFPRQQEAISYCILLKEPCFSLFAYEKSNGKRKYLVTTCKQFWAKYELMEKRYFHFYEVIRECKPCRLYFDIEFKTELNENLNGISVLNFFIDIVCKCLFEAFGIECTRNDVVDLDSTTDSKFSRHLIFHFKDSTYFRNNIQCGDFVKDVCFALRSYVETGNPNKYFPHIFNAWPEYNNTCADDIKVKLKKLLVASDNGPTFLCDLSVYSKNRNFRLYRSSKVSKHVPLCIAKENEYKFKTHLTAIEREVYRIKNRTFDADYQKFSDTLVCPFIEDIHNVNLLNFGDDGAKVSKYSQNQSAYTTSKEFEEGSQRTHFPTLDIFVLKQANKHGEKSIIRRWMFYRKSQMMIYDIGENRWCGNIQRQHKSNHVYYVADLKLCVLYQKCHDPDCINYRSEDVRIPDEVNPAIEEDNIEQFDISGDEELNNLFNVEFDIDDNLNVIENRGNKKGSTTQSCENAENIPPTPAKLLLQEDTLMENDTEFDIDYLDFDDEDFDIDILPVKVNLKPLKQQENVKFDKELSSNKCTEETKNNSCVDLIGIDDDDEDCGDSAELGGEVNANRSNDDNIPSEYLVSDDLSDDIWEEFFQLEDDSLLQVL